MSEHRCGPRCKAIINERTGGGQTKVWNSLSFAEQGEWAAQEHSWSVLSPLYRAARAAKVLFGRVD